jgi:hypothetical protein
MDGQVVGSSAVATALATVTPGDGLSIADDQTNTCCTAPDDIDEVAIYPAALSPARISAHWSARLSTAPGMSIIAGTAAQGTGGGVQGARAQACPTSGQACVVNAAPTTSSGYFHMLVPDGTYTVTVFPPAGSPSGPQPIPDVTVPPDVLNLSVTFSPPSGLPPGVSVSTPSTGTQQNTVPQVNWGEPITVNVTGQCKGGFGAVGVQAVNSSTGEPDARSAGLTETPAGSGNYVGQLTPLAPLHGLGGAIGAVVCPGHTPVLPNGALRPVGRPPRWAVQASPVPRRSSSARRQPHRSTSFKTVSSRQSPRPEPARSR